MVVKNADNAWLLHVVGCSPSSEPAKANRVVAGNQQTQEMSAVSVSGVTLDSDYRLQHGQRKRPRIPFVAESAFTSDTNA